MRARVAVLEEHVGMHRVTARFRVRGDGATDPDQLSWDEPESDRDLSIDDALEIARGRSEQVGVYLHSEAFSAGTAPLDDLPVWPPPGLDLRPRWDYEPADGRRFDAWRVLTQLRGDAIRADDVRGALAIDPRVLEVRRFIDHGAPERTGGLVDGGSSVQAGGSVPTSSPGSGPSPESVLPPGSGASPDAVVTVEYVVAHRDDEPATLLPWRLPENCGATVWLLGPDAPADEIGPPLGTWFAPTG